MRARLRTTLAVSSAALLAAGGGCGDAQPLRIGIVVGETAVPGARAAEEAVNATGGIGGRPLELVLLPESATDAEPAIRGAERLSADPTILAVVGHGNSAASLAASQVYNAQGLPHVAPTSTASLLSLAGPYSFRVVPGDGKQAAFLATEASRLAAARTVAIVYSNDDYGRGLQMDLASELAARGVRVAAAIPFIPNSGGEAMAFVPRKLASSPPEVVFWLARHNELPEFMAALRGALPDVLVMASDGVDRPSVYASPAEFAGLYFVRFVDAVAGHACMKRLRGRPDALMGGRSEDVLTYDAVIVVAEVMRAGARTRAQVRDGLAAVGNTAPPVQGCAGPIRFDSAGDVERPYLLARVDSLGVFPVPAVP